MLADRKRQNLTLLPQNKILDWTKSKKFADDKLNVAKMMISLFDRMENTVGKGENAGYWLPAFSPFFPHPLFSKGFLFKFIKSWDCVVKC